MKTLATFLSRKPAGAIGAVAALALVGAGAGVISASHAADAEEQFRLQDGAGQCLSVVPQEQTLRPTGTPTGQPSTRPTRQPGGPDGQRLELRLGDCGDEQSLWTLQTENDLTYLFNVANEVCLTHRNGAEAPTPSECGPQMQPWILTEVSPELVRIMDQAKQSCLNGELGVGACEEGADWTKAGEEPPDGSPTPTVTPTDTPSPDVTPDETPSPTPTDTPDETPTPDTTDGDGSLVPVDV